MQPTFVAWPAARTQSAVADPAADPSPEDNLMATALVVLRMAAALEPDPLEALAWYRSVPIAVLDGLTAAELVRQGRAHAVLTFLRAAIEIDRAGERTLQ